MNKFVYGLAKILSYPVKWIFPAKIFGPVKLPQKRSILIGNHVSGWDPVVLYAHLKTHVCFLYKAEFDKNRFLHWGLSGLDFIPVHRGDVDLAATKSCIRTLQQERVLGLFPEGARNPDVEVLQPLKTGVALFALKTKSPIRPFYVWDKARPFRRNYYMIGEEFTLEEFYDQAITKELLNEVTEYIRGKMQEIRFAALDILKAKGKKRRKRTKKELAKIEAYYKNIH